MSFPIGEPPGVKFASTPDAARPPPSPLKTAENLPIQMEGGAPVQDEEAKRRRNEDLKQKLLKAVRLTQAGGQQEPQAPKELTAVDVAAARNAATVVEQKTWDSSRPMVNVEAGKAENTTAAAAVRSVREMGRATREKIGLSLADRIKAMQLRLREKQRRLKEVSVHLTPQAEMALNFLSGAASPTLGKLVKEPVAG